MPCDDLTDTYRSFKDSNAHYFYRVEYNTFVVESLRLVYMDLPKAAGTSMKTLLASIEQPYVQPVESHSNETVAEMFIHDRVQNPVRSVTDFDETLQAEMLFSDNWHRLCVIRNPFNRLFSAWFSKILLRQPGYTDVFPGYRLPEKFYTERQIIQAFEDFIDCLNKNSIRIDPHWDTQSRLLFHGDLDWRAICKFEQLTRDLIHHKALFNDEPMTIDRLNVSGYRLDWSKVCDRTIEKIQLIYAMDFETFDYSNTPPQPDDTSNLLTTYVNAVAGRNKTIENLFEWRAQAEDNESQLMDMQGLVEKQSSSIEAQLSQIENQRKNLETLLHEKSHRETVLLKLNKKFEALLPQIDDQRRVIEQQSQVLADQTARIDELVADNHSLTDQLRQSRQLLSYREQQLSLIGKSKGWRLILFYRRLRDSIRFSHC